jgi:hypothetical protein
MTSARQSVPGPGVNLSCRKIPRLLFLAAPALLFLLLIEGIGGLSGGKTGQQPSAVGQGQSQQRTAISCASSRDGAGCQTEAVYDALQMPYHSIADAPIPTPTNHTGCGNFQACSTPGPTPTDGPRPPACPGTQVCQPTDPTNTLSGYTCVTGSCTTLATMLQIWTRWLSWLIGGFGVIWVMAAFYRGSEPYLGFTSEGPWRRIFLRMFEAGFIFFIAWRIGDIAMIVEGILVSNQKDAPTIGSNGVGAPPHDAIAQLIGLIIGVMIQLFLIYLSPRVVMQAFWAIGILITTRVGYFLVVGAPAHTVVLRKIALTSMVQVIGLGIGIVYAPGVMIWILSYLASH